MTKLQIATALRTSLRGLSAPRGFSGAALMVLLSAAAAAQAGGESEPGKDPWPELEARTLGLGASTVVHNRTHLGRSTWEAEKRAVMNAADGRGTFASVAEAVAIRGALAAEGRERSEQLRDLPEVIVKTALSGLLSGVAPGDVMSLDDFRNGPFRIAEEWLFEGRRNEIARKIAAVELLEACNHLAVRVEDLARERAGEENPEASKGLGIAYLNSIKRDGITSGGRPWGKGVSLTRGVEIRYSGKAPLSNVVVVVCAPTSGRSMALSPAQKKTLRFNADTGFDNHNRDIALFMQMDNLLESMPIAGYAYLPALRTGDVVRVCLPMPESAPQTGIATKLYCDQWQSPLTRIDKSTRKVAKGENGARATEPVLTAEIREALAR